MNQILFRKYSLFLALSIFFFSFVGFVNAVPVDWWGKVTINSNTSTDGAIVTAHINGSSTASATDIVGTPNSGYYLIHVPCSPGENVTFKVYGVTVDEPVQNCSGFSNELNLTMSTLANGQTCSYAQACSSGYCVHGYCRSSSTHCGDGYCDGGESCSADNSACPSGYECTNGCVAVSSTTTGKAVSQETQTFSITAGSSKIIDFTKESYIGIQDITITVKNTVSNAKITIKKEDTKPSSVTTPSGVVYNYLTFTTSNIVEEDISKAKIKFKVKKSWISENNIDRNTIALNRYTTKWEKLDTKILSEDSNYIYFEATTYGFSVFAITGEKKKEISIEKPKKPVCGNGKCEEGENNTSSSYYCPEDCFIPPPPEEICTPNELRCYENELQKCNSEGMEWNTLEVCKYGCYNNKCKGKNYIWVILLGVIAFLLLVVLSYSEIAKRKTKSKPKKSKRKVITEKQKTKSREKPKK